VAWAVAVSPGGFREMAIGIGPAFPFAAATAQDLMELGHIQAGERMSR